MKKFILQLRRVCWGNRINLIFAILSAILIHFMFVNMKQLFYTFDEWKILGTTYVNGPLGEINLLTPLEMFSGKARIFALIIGNLTFYFAPFRAYPLVIFAYVFQLLNGAMMYLIVKKTSRSKFLAFIAGMFFVTAGVASEVFSWLAATYENLFAVFFSLVSVYVYLNLSKHKNIQLRQRIASWVCVVFAYYFKETSIVLAIVLPWLYWILHRKDRDAVTQTVKRHMPLFILFLAIGVSRILTHFVIPGHSTFAQHLNPSIPRIFFHLISYPFTTLAHLFIPYDLMVRLSDLFFRLQYSTVTSQDYLRNIIIGEYLSFVITIALLLYLWVVVRPVKKYSILLSFAIIYYVLQCVPLALYDRDKGIAYFASRYYYVFVPSGAIVFALIADSVRRYLSGILRSSFLAIFITGIAASLFLYKQALVMRRNIFGAAVYGQRMKHAMEQFSALQPNLPDKPIIYISGNTEYYMLPRQYIPIPLNPGYALMVWYYKTGKIPGELIMEPYHFDQGEGYREIGDKAYGYFNDREHLLALFEENSSVSLDQVIGFYYDGSTDQITNITEETREFLQSKRY